MYFIKIICNINISSIFYGVNEFSPCSLNLRKFNGHLCVTVTVNTLGVTV